MAIFNSYVSLPEGTGTTMFFSFESTSVWVDTAWSSTGDIGQRRVAVTEVDRLWTKWIGREELCSASGRWIRVVPPVMLLQSPSTWYYLCYQPYINYIYIYIPINYIYITIYHSYDIIDYRYYDSIIIINPLTIDRSKHDITPMKPQWHWS